jgi:MFS family permease
MFQLYKNRSFGEYVSETFDFLRADGKHFFTQFFTIFGIPVLIVSFMLYYLTSIGDSFKGINSNNYLESFIQNNLPLFIILLVLFLILLFIFSFLIYSFPVLYLKLYQEKKGTNFSITDLLNEFKVNFWKIVVFFLLMFFTLIIIMIIAIIPFVVLFITIIGIFVILFLSMGIALFSMLSLYVYLNNKDIGYMDAIGISFQHIKKNFWSTIGSFMIIYLIVSVISGIFSLMGGGFDIAKILTTIETGTYPEEEEFGIKTIMKAILVTLSYIVSYTLSNLITLNAGLIYYSMQDHKENINVKSDIDLIGTQEID